MNSKWEEAARKYEDAKQDVEEKRIRSAGATLDMFIASEEGRSATRLLAASTYVIPLAEDGPEGGRTIVYALGKDGFVKITSAAGMHLTLGKADFEPIFEIIVGIEAVNAAVKYGRKKPEDVLNFIREKLDKVAEEAPKR